MPAKKRTKRSGAKKRGKAAPKATRRGKRASRTATRKPRPAPKAAREVLARDRAVDELGKRVRPGKVRLGGTRRLTPTKAGFRALKRELLGVQRSVTKKGAKAKAYAFQLSIRYRGPDGRFKKLERIEGTFPLKKSVRARRRKGESEAQAFERITEDRIKGAVFRAIDRNEGVAAYPDFVKRALASGNRERITKAMRSFKKRRGVTFKVDIERHVTTGEAVSHGKNLSRNRRKRKAARRK